MLCCVEQLSGPPVHAIHDESYSAGRLCKFCLQLEQFHHWTIRCFDYNFRSVKVNSIETEKQSAKQRFFLLFAVYFVSCVVGSFNCTQFVCNIFSIWYALNAMWCKIHCYVINGFRIKFMLPFFLLISFSFQSNRIPVLRLKKFILFYKIKSKVRNGCAHKMTSDQLNAMVKTSVTIFMVNNVLRVYASDFPLCDILMRIVTRSTIIHNYRYCNIVCEDKKHDEIVKQSSEYVCLVSATGAVDQFTLLLSNVNFNVTTNTFFHWEKKPARRSWLSSNLRSIETIN